MPVDFVAENQSKIDFTPENSKVDFVPGDIKNLNATKPEFPIKSVGDVGRLFKEGYSSELGQLRDILNFAPIGSAKPPAGVLPAAANWLEQQITPGNLVIMGGTGAALGSKAVSPLVKKLIGGLFAAKGIQGVQQTLSANQPQQPQQQLMSGPVMPGTFVGLPGAEGAVAALMQPTLPEGGRKELQQQQPPVGTPGQQTSELLDYVANALMAAGGTRGALHKYATPPITPEVLPAEAPRPSNAPRLEAPTIDIEEFPVQKQLTDAKTDVKNMRPAVKVGEKIFVGEYGDTHTDVLHANGLDSKAITHFHPDRGFVDVTKPEVFLDRKAAEKVSGLKGTAEAGGLDSQDLPNAALSKLERMMKENEQKQQPKAAHQESSTMSTQEKAQARERMGRGETQFFSGAPVPQLEKAWDSMKKWYIGPPKDTKDWSPLSPPNETEILESKTATPITSKIAGVKLPTEGPDTTLADKLIGTQNEFSKKIAAVQDLANKGDKMYSPMDVVFDMADGGKATFDGPLFRNIRWPLDFDFNAELNLRRQKTESVRDLIKKYDLKEKNGLRLGIYAMVQQGARDRLIKNGVSATYIDNILKTLTPQEKEVYSLARRQLDSMLPLVQAVAKDVLGMDVQPVENYFPMQRDWRDIPKPPADLAKPRSGDLMSDAVDFLQADFTKRGAKTERSFVEERTPNAKTAVKLNFFDIYERHVKDVAHFVASQKRLNDIAKIVRDPKFAEKYGDVTQKLTMEWLNAYAKQGRGVNALPQLDWYRKAVARGVLGFRLTSQFVHLANVPLGMQRAGAVNYSRGLAFAMSEEGQAFLKANLAETFERGGGELELLEKQGPVGKAAFAPQRFLDRWNSQATTLGVYLREGGKTEGPVNQAALAKARVEARRAVASPLYKDLPPMLRTQAGKIFAQFQNTFMDQWSNIRYDLPEYLRNDPKKAMGLFVALTAMLVVESGIKYGEKKARHELLGYHPKTDKDATFEKKLADEALKRLPGYGQIASAIEYDSSGVPVLDVARETLKAGASTYKAVKEGNKTDKVLAAEHAATGIGEVLGVPGAGYAGQIMQEATKAKAFKPHQARIEEFAVEHNVDLRDFKQRPASETYLKQTREPMTEQDKVRSAQAAIKNMAERRQKILDSLSPEDKKWLKQNRIEPPGFGDYVSKNKVRVPFTDKENAFAVELYKTSYENVISFLRNDSGFKQLNDNAKQIRANELFREAAKKAHEQMQAVVKSGQLVEKPKKRFSAFSAE